MPQLVFRAAARREIAEIAAYIEGETKSSAVADTFVDKLVGYCEHLAQLPGLLGRAQPELARNYRSIVFGKYGDDEEPRSHLYIVHGARDLDAYFSQRRD